MPDDQPIADSPPPKKPVRRRSPAKNFLFACKDAILEQFPFLKPFVTFTEREAKGIRRGWVLIAVLGVAVAGTAAWITFGVAKSKSETRMDATNIFYRGQIDGLKKALDVSTGEKAVLERQRDKAESDLAPMRLLANSHFTNTPLTERLDKLYDSFTESLKGAEFLFYVNDLPITNNSVIKLEDNRLEVMVHNSSKKAVQDVVISVQMNIGRSNVVSFDGWETQGIVLYQNGVLHKDEAQPRWVVRSVKPTASHSLFASPPLIFATNAPAIIPLIIQVHAVGSGTQTTNILVKLK